MTSERKPRLCLMTKGDSGYGFHLHGEKGKSGQFIRKVEPGSPAEASGLRAGDRLVAVNGVNVEKETHHQVVQRIKAVDNETRLLVVDPETQESLRSLRLTATEDMAVPGTGQHNSCPSPTASSSSVPSSTSKKQENGSASKLPMAASNQVQKPTRRSPSKAATKETPPQTDSQTQSHSQPKVDPSRLAPRLCHLVRSENGYGFNLHSDRSRPGQYIRSLDPGSPADRAGLRPQDRLIEVNGTNIEGMRHADVVAFIKRGGDETWLLVVDPETDAHFKKRGVVPTVALVTDYDGPSISNGSTGARLNGSSSTHSTLSSRGNSTQLADEEGSRMMDPFAEMGLSATAAEEKMKIHAKEKKKAPQMDWIKKYELFSNF
ncbi:Na(+)/H(+) exchange regulatory cofactor NHE-RF2 [Takifugu rubripes]|uniref:Na(+)/H(+) exchange regulatory cofactor NHE-RF n=2 Tax=Takifugu TaxID=31032 RepID=A0A3B5JU99_TAKRU|nr:Na(+)/H(+) exchange regulatory cofactor NHE-RF2-like [Takifugu rubripes]XP_056871923.1 Na(+)/H(+) exchange regulatory cofactor NHE-RF2 [Takifugu flavidus]TWW69908.1 Na(+)/H(+) exchange regulatory cofactor NHE-RF2 [Takifugu flavidus]|eukprot:XP_011602226.1 PREDICTED: Na(+)/H(+) exchange regulatory cofactor NHE-RF2-like [Takifugu rubripes]